MALTGHMGNLGLRLAAFLGLASLAFGQVLDTPHGQVEFIGLKSWNAKQVYDKLVQIDPQNPLCMVGLEKMGAAASSVNKEFKDKRLFTRIIVVEPQFSDRVKRRLIPVDELRIPGRWADALKFLDQDFDGYMTALQLYDYRLDQKADAVLKDFGPYAETIRKIWTVVSQLSEAKDRDLAAWIIMNDKNVRHRIAAASVLANFPGFDSTWWTLVEAMRYDDMAGYAAEGTLRALGRALPREIDWTLAAASIRALIEGTNPAHLLGMIGVLTQTNISSRLAVPLLSNGGFLLVEFLKASRDQERAPVRNFLTGLAGKDLGPDPAPWTQWIESLGKNVAK